MTALIIYILVFLPMIAAVIIYTALKNSNRAQNIALIGVTAICFALSVILLFTPESEAAVPGLCAMGATFTHGGFRTVMAVVVSGVWLMSAMICPAYFEGEERTARFYAFMLLVLGPTLGVFFAADLMTLFVFFEIMSLSSYVWVAHNETPEAQKASETYLYIGIIGGLAMLTGIIILFASCGTLRIDALKSAAEPLSQSRKMLICLLMLTGFGAKAGMFPVHVWLPAAHPAAPTPGSVLLSGILLKCGIFGTVILSCRIFAENTAWGNLLLILAACTMFIGALLALFSTNIKRTLACSSMSQIGFILTGVAMSVLLGEESGMAASGAVLHVINHALIKACLFTCAAVIYLNTHSLDLNKIKGFGKGKPLLLVCFLSAACSIAGIPGFSGYISKTLIHESIVEYIELLEQQGLSAAPYSIVEWVFLISGGLTFAYMARLFYIVFIAKRPDDQKHKTGSYIDRLTSAVIIVCALYMPVMGLTANKTMNAIACTSAPFFLAEGVGKLSYFSLTNLKGALISIAIGCLVFIFIGMKWMTKRSSGEEIYLDRWPKWLDMEYSFYRPLLKTLAFIGTVAARLVETVGSILVLGPIQLVFYKAEKEWRPALDNDFGTYTERKTRPAKAISYDMVIAFSGAAIFLAFVLIKLLMK